MKVVNEEAQNLDERGDEEAHIVDERSDEEAQIMDERSDEEAQIMDERSDEEAQILDEMSDMNLKQYIGIDFDKLTVEEIKGKEFNKVEDAESFFFAYAKAMGFSVRRDEQRWSSKAPRVNIRRWLCSAQGERSVGKTIKVRAPKQLSRFNCPCLFRVRYCKKKDLYVVVAFVAKHSHTLAQAHESHLLRSHRSVLESHFSLAASLRRVSMKTCHAYEHMADKVGGFSKLGFTLKDLYNKLYSKRREMFPGIGENLVPLGFDHNSDGSLYMQRGMPLMLQRKGQTVRSDIFIYNKRTEKWSKIAEKIPTLRSTLYYQVALPCWPTPVPRQHSSIVRSRPSEF